MYVLLMCRCQYLRRCVNTGGHKGFGWGGGDKELAYLHKYSINAPLCGSRKPPSLTLLAALPHPPPSLSLPSKRGAWERDYEEVSRGTEVHKWSIRYLHSFLCGQTTQGPSGYTLPAQLPLWTNYTGTKWSIHYLHSFLCGQTTQGPSGLYITCTASSVDKLHRDSFKCS